jgi:hypothetical protein
MSEDAQNLRRLLADSGGLLGPCTPQPALFEEVVRAWRGHAVHTARWKQAAGVMRQIQRIPDGDSLLYASMCDAQIPWDSRLLAATLLAMPHQENGRPPLADLDDPAQSALLAIAHFTEHHATAWYLRQLGAGLKSPTSARDRPALLSLVCFLKGLCADALPPHLFAAAVQRGGVFSPRVGSRRPFRHLHRLLDYLGLSGELHVLQLYRGLIAKVWPAASAENYAEWEWISAPGGPELFPTAIAALQEEEWTLPRLHEWKFLPLPHQDRLADFLAPLPLPLQQLLDWLRPGVGRFTALPGGQSAWQWMRMANHKAAATVYANPAWWEEWRQDGLPVARDVLRRLQDMSLPEASLAQPQDRHQWLEAHYLPHYRQISANILLAQAAGGESLPLLQRMAAEGDPAAARALALVPDITSPIIDTLRQLMQRGNRPLQAAARQALGHLAQRQGLPGVDELHRQSLLTLAWDPGPLRGERVRVLWEAGGYRIRLALQRGKVELQVLGPRGVLSPVPAAVRRSDAYRQARDAQRQAQVQYRLFKQALETGMLESRPMALGEFNYLLHNPIFAHLAERLLWQTSCGDIILWAGPDRWETCAGERVDLEASAKNGLFFLQVVHPLPLVRAGTLVVWQSLAADRRLAQPFKQLFREVYLPDIPADMVCRRFAGRVIDPHRAYALLRAAGFAPGTGIARREWPHDLTANFCWADDVVGHDLFGPQCKEFVRTGGIWFTRGDERLELTDVEEIIISETLRAADLVTTRAAMGDADLTSRETLALRVTLLREVSRAFNLTNIAVREEGGYALVLGQHATYRVNLANGVVLLEPEGRQIILPQIEQHWQPSEEQVDITTRMLDIVLVLANDAAINDLTFLAQLSPSPYR